MEIDYGFRNVSQGVSQLPVQKFSIYTDNSRRNIENPSRRYCVIVLLTDKRTIFSMSCLLKDVWVDYLAGR